MSCVSRSLKLAIVNSDWLPAEAVTFLESKPEVESVAILDVCELATLQLYDVVLIHGNPSCPEELTHIDEYVNGGGGVVMIPWVIDNGYEALESLPVVAGDSGADLSTLDVTVTDASDVLLQGVTFTAGDEVGYESYAMTLKTGATSSVHWNDDVSSLAASRMPYGTGRSVYLDFHYFTDDSCPVLGGDSGWPDAPYAWAEQLLLNSVLWLGDN